MRILICEQWSFVNERVNIIHLRGIAPSENVNKTPETLPASMEQWLGRQGDLKRSTASEPVPLASE
jgi:hypothetical protein